jgi:hypothetical protein
MIPLGFKFPQDGSISTEDIRGRSPPRPGLILRYAFVHPNRKENANGNAIRTEVQRSLRR